jgi:hypothetical protein
LCCLEVEKEEALKRAENKIVKYCEAPDLAHAIAQLKLYGVAVNRVQCFLNFINSTWFINNQSLNLYF